jgi:hypothetical protein
MSTGSGAPVATITGQTQGVGVDASGRAGPGFTVRFTTTKGQDGSVFVPQSSYYTAGVRAAVRAQAALMDEVLGSTVEGE